MESYTDEAFEKGCNDRLGTGFTFLNIGLSAGVSSSGKTRVFGIRIRRFESSHPSQHIIDLIN